MKQIFCKKSEKVTCLIGLFCNYLKLSRFFPSIWSIFMQYIYDWIVQLKHADIWSKTHQKCKKNSLQK